MEAITMSNTLKIGLEVHCAMSTKTKLFCSCPNKVVGEPNTLTCPICLGMPGSKPALNKQAVNDTLKIAKALKCKINKEFYFSRKTYFYNDLAKNFQITQYEIPLAKEGELSSVRIRRVHMEEDPGKTIHVNGPITDADYTLIDYNRSGVPLVEIVTEPDIKNPEHAKLFLKELTSILEYLGVYNDSREGALRVDANISTTGKRVEIKNMSSFREVEKALEYELNRQRDEVPKTQETRTWDPESEKTFLLRSKEKEEDYGYIFEPDLTKIVVTKEQLNIKLPEMASARAERYKTLGLSAKVIESLTSEPKLAEAFDYASEKVNPKLAANFFSEKLLKTLNYKNLKLGQTKITKQALAELLQLLEQKKLTERSAEFILRDMVEGKKMQFKESIADEKELNKIINKVLDENPNTIIEYKSGKKEVINFLFGQVMKKTGARADPSIVRKLLLKRLG
jgi:aspartyl-tRNA(Asn)/glutamyl-tRNA(Gln) amidotransferase subunit B